jgi:GNAT superfamily N-acetyltransferase
MKTKQITPLNADNQIRHLYETAFPEDEQIPWDDLMRLIDEMPLDFTAYYEVEGEIEPREDSAEGQFIGFTILYPRKSFHWFWYFAVKEELRGKGYGQKILTRLLERYKGQACVLDMESPMQVSENSEQRRRRHAFYLRNGFRDTNVYRSYNDITMTIMMIGEGTFTLHDWDMIVNELKRFWWPKGIGGTGF